MTTINESSYNAAILLDIIDEDQVVRANAFDHISSVVIRWVHDTLATTATSSQRAKRLSISVSSLSSSDRSSVWDEVFDVPENLFPGHSRNSVVDDHIGDSNNNNTPLIEACDIDSRKSLQDCLVRLLGFVIDCPFVDVRYRCNRLLDKVEALGFPVADCATPSPSFVIPLSETVGYYHEPTGSSPGTVSPFASPTDESGFMFESSSSRQPSFSSEGMSLTQSLAQKRFQPFPVTFASSSSFSSSSSFPSIPSCNRHKLYTAHTRPMSRAITSLHQHYFLKYHRTTNMIRLLSYWPEYLDIHSRCTTYLLFDCQNSSPIPLVIRIYLSIMAAAECKCQYYVSLLQKFFVACGGEPQWLAGLDHVPDKIRSIAPINTLLAHQPWLLSNYNLEPTWSYAELGFILPLLACFHATSTLALAVGLVPETDTQGGYIKPQSWLDYTDDNNNISVYNHNVEDTVNPALIDFSKFSSPDSATITTNSTTNTYLHSEEYSWEYDGVIHLEQFGSGLSRLIEERFRRACSINSSPNIPISGSSTPESRVPTPPASRASISTSRYSFSNSFSPASFQPGSLASQFILPRTASSGNSTSTSASSTTTNTSLSATLCDLVWAFSLKQIGIVEDNYNHNCTIDSIDPPIMQYLDCISNQPDLLKSTDWSSMTNVNPQDKVAMAILTCDARFKGSLCYALRALSNSKTV